MSDISNILVPTDLSPHSDAALKLAEKIGKPFNATLHFLLVYQIDTGPHPKGEIDIPNDFWGTDREGAQKILDDMKVEVEKRAALPIKTHLLDGNPEDIICEQAEIIPADLIVMGSRGRTGLHHWLIGSVAERVMRGASCPVLVEKAFEADADFKRQPMDQLPRRPWRGKGTAKPGPD